MELNGMENFWGKLTDQKYSKEKIVKVLALSGTIQHKI